MNLINLYKWMYIIKANDKKCVKFISQLDWACFDGFCCNFHNLNSGCAFSRRNANYYLLQHSRKYVFLLLQTSS